MLLQQLCLHCVCMQYYYPTAMIMHTLDVHRVSVLMITLTCKKVEIFDIEFDQKGSTVKTKSKYSKTVLFLLKCVLDVAMSIATSVIVSLLLLSGDIEQNPGPLGGKSDNNQGGGADFSHSVGLIIDS